NFSHPGTLQWQEQFTPGRYLYSFWAFGQENFLDPGPPAIVGPDTQVWYYCFYPTNVFVQQGGVTAPKTYRLMSYAQPPAGQNLQYGWKATTNLQHDISVFAPWPGAPPPAGWPWNPTRLPTGLPLDLAFKLTTDTNRCPIPVICAGDKTVQC